MNERSVEEWFRWALPILGSGITQYLPLQGATIVVLMILADWLTGTTVAIRTGTFSLSELWHGTRKLYLWGLLLLVSTALRHPWGTDVDWGLKFFGDYLIFYLCLCELISVLRNVAMLAVLDDIDMPWIAQLLDALQRAGDKGFERMQAKLGLVAQPPQVEAPKDGAP